VCHCWLAQQCRDAASEGIVVTDQPQQSDRYSLAAVVRCISIALVVAGFSGCAMYRFGAPALYRQDIRTVYVPMITSDS
jgi:hypothetical protein